jgi:SnoaL-like domain
MSTPDPRIDWLVDRAQISDLLVSFAWALDSRNWEAYAVNYADGGYVELPDPLRPGEWIVLHKADMVDHVPKTLGRYSGTHHLSTNHAITVDGD